MKSDERAEKEREIVSVIDGLLVSICFLSYIVCMTLGFVPKITGDELIGVTTLSWFCSLCMAFSLSQKFDGFSSPEMSSKFRQRLTILFFIYLTGVMFFFHADHSRYNPAHSRGAVAVADICFRGTWLESQNSIKNPVCLFHVLSL
jgi:hypothetical protein